MSDQFVAEIRIFPTNFAPTGWATCDGQLLAISQNTALFSLLGTVYGGDGKSTFGLPNLMGRVPMHPGQGQGLSLRDLGEMDGSDNVTLLTSEMPLHNHVVNASLSEGVDRTPSAQRFSTEVGGVNSYAVPLGTAGFAPEALAPAGGGQPHTNLMPYLTFTICIALQGVFPPRG